VPVTSIPVRVLVFYGGMMYERRRSNTKIANILALKLLFDFIRSTGTGT
jgi:hypothetical protein